MYINFRIVIRPHLKQDFLKELRAVDPEARAGIISEEKYSEIMLNTEIAPRAIEMRDDVLDVSEDNRIVPMHKINQEGELI